MDIAAILNELTLEEKAKLLTGASGMSIGNEEKLHMNKTFADGPHGVRGNPESKCVHFPNLCCVGATWDTSLVFDMGVALGDECIEHGIDLLLAPGINIKRTPLCGRNFEYLSEDPVIAGELGAAYINGIQHRGVGTSLKHYALNNQEIERNTVSVEIDLRVMREIYLKAFEIAVKKSKPYSVMCSYNKVHSIWVSENKHLLTDILKKEWGYEGFVMSDWGAVQDICRSVNAGLDLQMPMNHNIVDQIKAGLADGRITMEAIDNAVKAVVRFLVLDHAKAVAAYDRAKQHALARKIAGAGIVLLKNDDNILPITSQKFKRVAVMGEYAVNPLICGQGAAEVYCGEENIDSPLEEMKKILGDDVELTYMETFKRRELPGKMIWPDVGIWWNFVKDADAVVIFAGAMESEDTEQFDRVSMKLNPNMEFVIEKVAKVNPNVIVVLQSGSALTLGRWRNQVKGIVQMWLGGESAGGAIADVLTGKISPSGRLTETFPTCMRTDMDYPGDGYKVRYNEGFDIGYRYYDKHPEEVCYPFGYGLSYTTFEHSDFAVERKGDKLHISCKVTNTGTMEGGEVVQVYVAKKESAVTRPVKELKTFSKVFLEPGESAQSTMLLDIQDLAYFNVMLNEWVVEPGEYTVMFASNAREILCSIPVFINEPIPYSLKLTGTTMVG